MRSYDQYCALARALDLVGDRWSLLVVRELLSRPCRFRELQDGLPGISTNLLTERLRHLEASGVVARDENGRYGLTDWGRRLATPVRELVRWGALLMKEKADSDAFRVRWLELPLELMFAGFDPQRPDAEIEVRTADGTISFVARDGRVTVRSGPAVSPDVVISGPPAVIVGLLAGRLDPESAGEQGVRILGDSQVVFQLRAANWLDEPRPEAAAPSGDHR